MLVLSRKPQEKIVIDGRITVTVIKIRGRQIQLGIEAPKEIPVHREEHVSSVIERLPAGTSGSQRSIR
jgi:carbon storage regulator